ncbi:MAG: hypothetical protein LKJ21_03210 [Oscillospiraceae bacterium]|jgi:hypothetical protein|nr:hypothetical protein [Oscillospiraceae bacterium]MCI1990006.1 hypothetical protein [Oscillospiraceae bacterium]MCI2034822.1 hypothetical protein [Oscillospiraceae bacterium]
MAEIEIGGVKLSLDLDDLNVAEKVKTSIAAVKDKAAAAQKNGVTDYVESGRKVCGYVEECFDSIFGTGTGKKLFGGRAKFSEHIDAFAQLAEATVGQLKGLNDHFSSLSAKYSPNRAARRRSNMKVVK